MSDEGVLRGIDRELDGQTVAQAIGAVAELMHDVGDLRAVTEVSGATDVYGVLLVALVRVFDAFVEGEEEPKGTGSYGLDDLDHSAAGVGEQCSGLAENSADL
ncbi:hypothetical protein [Streptomyces sp. NPDC059278]|uniref:hypothetical protein n=1 Tax=Streptomyces sp. NPDC059278 TaxID=3346801 RepID=UPI0036AA6729